MKGSGYIGTPKKYYFEDVGLRNARLGFRQVEETHLMENVIYNELRARGYSVDVGAVEERSKLDGKDKRRRYEVDFVANLGYRRYYVQSALKLDSPEKVTQEKRPLLGIGDSFRKIMVVKDVVRPYMDEDGILTMGLFDFLLDSGSLDMCTVRADGDSLAREYQMSTNGGKTSCPWYTGEGDRARYAGGYDGFHRGGTSEALARPVRRHRRAPLPEDLPHKGDTVIGNDVWIGQNAVILPGVHIGDGVIIGANSVVGKDVEPYTVVGNPAKALRKRFDDEPTSLLLAFKWWDKEIEEINALIPLLACNDIEKVKGELKAQRVPPNRLESEYSPCKSCFYHLD